MNQYFQYVTVSNNRFKAEEAKRHNKQVAKRRMLYGNLCWVAINVILAKVYIMAPAMGNMLNVSAFLLTVGAIVSGDVLLSKLEVGCCLVEIAIWVGQLL